MKAGLQDPGLQPERTALSWRRTIMSVVVADLLIWRGWLHALTRAPSEDGLMGADHSAQVVGLGICALVACLTTIVLVACASSRIRTLHACAAGRQGIGHIGASAHILRTASAAIVALAVATVGALALGF